MNGSEIQIDKKTIAALSVESRIAILKSLSKRQMTPTELADELNFSKSTVHKHLQKLVAAGLVERVEHNKWVYYRLTKKGRIILSYNAVKVVFLFTTSVLALVGALYGVLLYFGVIRYRAPEYIYDPVYLILGELLLLVSILAGYYGYKILKERRKVARLLV